MVPVAAPAAAASAPQARSYDGYLTRPWLLNAHVGAGLEPHGNGIPVTFGVGGAALWMGGASFQQYRLNEGGRLTSAITLNFAAQVHAPAHSSHG